MRAVREVKKKVLRLEIGEGRGEKKEKGKAMAGREIRPLPACLRLI